MQLVDAIREAGHEGCVSRPCFAFYPHGIPINLDGNGELAIEAELSISDLAANDWEVVV